MNDKEVQVNTELLLALRKLHKNSTHVRTNAGEPKREVLQTRPLANDTSEPANNCRSIAWLMFDNYDLFMLLFTQLMADKIDVTQLDDTEYVAKLLKELDKKAKQK